MIFADRHDAGQRLAHRLAHLRGQDLVILGLPRGGVPVAYEVAQSLHAPLDVIVVRKLGVPDDPELAAGAVGEGGVRILNDQVIRLAGVSGAALAEVEKAETANVTRRADLFRRGRQPIPLAGRTAVVVDDGVATGSTAQAACQVARAMGASRVVLAVPVADLDAVARLGRVADDVICVHVPDWLGAVGYFYDDFRPIGDDEVIALLDRAAPGRPPSKPLVPDGGR